MYVELELMSWDRLQINYKICMESEWFMQLISVIFLYIFSVELATPLLQSAAVASGRATNLATHPPF